MAKRERTQLKRRFGEGGTLGEVRNMQPAIPYCPCVPTPKQQRFIEASEMEVFFGGAAGGGKSVALLMSALLHVDKAGYAALILRKDVPRLCLAGGLVPRSHEWLAGSDAKWNQARRQWQFPVEDGPPATLTFGYLSRPLDKFRYASSEFQYIAFDELTDFLEEDYLFLFSRLRRVKSLDVPLRMRSASNPGGAGHLWVKQRFVGDDAASGGEPNGVIVREAGRLFIPSRIDDNEHLDAEQYRQSLLHLPAVARERLLNGDWSVQENAVFHAEWLRYFVETEGQLELLAPDGRTIATIRDGTCRRFVTIDPAGTSAEKASEGKGRSASWTVAQVWDQPPRELAKFLLLRHQVRVRVGFDGLCHTIRAVFEQWRPERLWIENEKFGMAAQAILSDTLPIECIATRSNDKETRAAPLVVKMERGEVFFPKYESTWRPGLEAEMLAWTGDKRQPADQVDAAAYAAIVVQKTPGGPIRLCLGAAE